MRANEFYELVFFSIFYSPYFSKKGEKSAKKVKKGEKIFSNGYKSQTKRAKPKNFSAIVSIYQQLSFPTKNSFLHLKLNFLQILQKILLKSFLKRKRVGKGAPGKKYPIFIFRS